MAVGTPLLFFLIGNKYGGKSSGFIFGMLAAFCSEFIFHSTDMLNPIPISFLVALSFYFVTQLADQKKVRFAFWLGLTIGIAINFHLQALGLLVMIPISSLMNHFSWPKKVKVFGLSLTGVLVSFIPLLYFSFSHENILLRNIFSFLTGSHNSSGSENNLLLDVLVFWPQLWGTTLAHMPLLGYGCIFLFLIALVFAFGNNKTFHKSFHIIWISFLCQILFLYFYSGARSPIYLIVFQAFFVFLSGWTVLNFYKANKYLGFTVLAIMVFLSMKSNLFLVKNSDSQVSTIMEIKHKIDGSNNSPITLMSDNNSGMIALPLYYLYLKEGHISDSGREIIACENHILKDEKGIDSKWSCPNTVPILFEKDKYKIYDRNQLNADQLKEFDLSAVDSETIFNGLYDNYK